MIPQEEATFQAEREKLGRRISYLMDTYQNECEKDNIDPKVYVLVLLISLSSESVRLGTFLRECMPKEQFMQIISCFYDASLKDRMAEEDKDCADGSKCGAS